MQIGSKSCYSNEDTMNRTTYIHTACFQAQNTKAVGVTHTKVGATFIQSICSRQCLAKWYPAWKLLPFNLYTQSLMSETPLLWAELAWVQQEVLWCWWGGRGEFWRQKESIGQVGQWCWGPVPQHMEALHASVADKWMVTWNSPVHTRLGGNNVINCVPNPRTTACGLWQLHYREAFPPLEMLIYKSQKLLLSSIMSSCGFF